MAMTNQSVQAYESNSIQITREIAQNVLTTIDAGLVCGVGIPVPGRMCVEAAVCYAMCLPPGDQPFCVASSLRALMIALNDADWSTPAARACGLRRLGLAQLGTKDALNEAQFVTRVLNLASTKRLPKALRAAASVHKAPEHQSALNSAAAQCESARESASCFEAGAVAIAAVEAAVHAAVGVVAEAAAAAAYTAGDAYDAIASENTGGAAQWATESAVKAAEAVAHACGPAEGAAERAEVLDRSLRDFAEDVLKILVDLRAPGCEWLDLTEAA